MVDWIPVGVAIGGSVGGGYLGVKITVTKLQTEMAAVKEEIKSLRQSRHHHGDMLQSHEARLHFLER